MRYPDAHKEQWEYENCIAVLRSSRIAKPYVLYDVTRGLPGREKDRFESHEEAVKCAPYLSEEGHIYDIRKDEIGS